MLGLVGKRLDTRGVIHSDDLGAAISRLEAAISEDDRKDVVVESFHYSAQPHQEAGHGLSRQAWPFLDMMREAHKQHAHIILGM